ncbi:hypothetical protein AC578_2766 [Pseudocercospora eumusae]|uniref:Uncharacterized protein n=1 Tax=Pseudocercospora eumusae TaxID=321146 RepID=A0A139HGW7_9PEZI|nr:hypothetical protein AC578_2766 [Pseudocercospora eumusae]
MTSAVGDHSHEGCFYSDTFHATKMYSMHYNPITTLALKAFIRARTNKDPPNGLRRQVPLQEMDRNWTFRFMDLPPEMRNIIYELLLMRNKAQRRKAFLAILRVSKEVHKEAVGIFNDVNTADLGISIIKRSSDSHSSDALYMSLNGHVRNTFEITDQSDVKTILGQGARGLARMRHVRLWLNISWYVGNAPNGNWILPTSLVSSIVAAGVDLRTLVIEGSGSGTDQDWIKWLRPLAQLPDKTALQLHGFRDEGAKRTILRQIKAANPKIDAETHECISILQQLDQEWTFRFMDLPPELRDLVYEELLIRNRETGRKAHLQILRVSQKVHKEAVSIFQDVTPANLDVIILRRCYHVPSPSLSLSISGDFKGRCEERDDDIETTLTRDVSTLPCLSNIELQLTIKPCCGSHDSDPDYSYPTKFMSAFVERAQSLRKFSLIVPVSNTMRFDSQQFLDWFDPLTQLSSEVALELYGFCQDTREQLKLRIEAAKSESIPKNE